MKARKKPIEVLAYRYYNVNIDDFLKLLRTNKDEPVCYDENTKNIYIKKPQGEIELNYGDYVIKEINTDNTFWFIDKDIFYKTYERIPNTIYNYKRKIYDVECIELKSLSYKDIVNVLDFVGYKVNEIFEIIQRDDLIDEIKKQGYININTLEGTLKMLPTDILIKGVNGEFYPVKREQFDKVYDIIENGE